MAFIIYFLFNLIYTFMLFFLNINKTALELAVEREYMDIIKILLKHKNIDVNCKIIQLSIFLIKYQIKILMAFFPYILISFKKYLFFYIILYLLFSLHFISYIP